MAPGTWYQLLFLLCCAVSLTAASWSCESYTVKVRCNGWDWFYWMGCKETKCHSSGTYRCTCPGNGRSVSYSISCALSSGSCSPTYSRLSCNKFTNCANCISGTSQSAGGCASCRAGWQLSSGFCTQDINECASSSLNTCEHICTNTQGSYVCSCRAGYALQTTGSCTPKSCGPPGNISNGVVTPSGSYQFNTAVSYTCNTNYTLIGNRMRHCIAGSYGSVYWNGSQPACVDACDAVSVADRQSCGRGDVNETECHQLGCCYQSTGTPRCYFAKGAGSLGYRGETPTVSALETLSDNTADACSLSCAASSQCNSFTMQTSSDSSTCRLFSQTRHQLVSGDMLTYGDDTVVLHEPLSYGASLSDTKNVTMLYAGCFDVSNFEETSTLIWSRNDNSPDRCVEACRKAKYTIAELRNGADCYCNSEYLARYSSLDSQNCTIPCSGDSTMMCGGLASCSVYRVPQDNRYMGCFADTQDNSTSVEDTLLWTRPNTASATDCMEDCQRAGYLYCAVYAGESCYCSNNIQRDDRSEVEYQRCQVSVCPGNPGEDCGGPDAMALYATEIGQSADQMENNNYRTLFFDSSRISEVSLQLFSKYLFLKSIITPRFALHVTGEVSTPNRSISCGITNCYSLCGDLTTQFSGAQVLIGTDQKIRTFFLNISQLSSLVNSAAKRVYVYAQTVVIDTDLQLPYSLQIYTRQLILNQTRGGNVVRLNTSSEPLQIDFSDRNSFGISADSTFAKQSFMCARILMDSAIQDNISTGWAILDDLTRSSPGCYDAEQCAWLNGVIFFNTFLTGTQRQNVRFVPYYSKFYFVRVLTLYYDRILVYKTDFDQLHNAKTTASDFQQAVDSLNAIYVTTSVHETKTVFDTAISVVRSSNDSYHQLKQRFESAAQVVNTTGQAFAGHVVKRSASAGTIAVVKGIASFIFDAIFTIGNLFASATEEKNARLEAEALALQVQTTLDISLSSMALDLFDLKCSISRLSRFSSVADQLMADMLNDNQTGIKYKKYSADLEKIINSKYLIVQFGNVKYDLEVIFSHQNVLTLHGCADYLTAILKMCDWGQAMMSAAIEYAELLREAVQHRHMLNSKLLAQQRYTEYANGLRQETVNQQAVTAGIVEQLHDLIIDINNILFSFCQAYFYETLTECSSAMRPSFGGTLSQLLSKVNRALQDSLLSDSTPSTVSRFVTITDEDCSNCPIASLRETGVMYYSLTTDNTALSDLSTYRVRTIFLQFVGAKRNETTGNQLLKVYIDSSGLFKGKEGDTIYDFVTNPRALAYEYDVVTGDISICADVYATYRNTVQHATPYTQWVIQVSSNSLDIDLSQLTSVKIRFLGSAVTSDDRRRYYLDIEPMSFNPCN